MSIIISDLAYHYPNQNNLFDQIHLTVDRQSKASVIGDNGVGKTTLLKLIAGILHPSEGSITCTATPYYIPQYSGWLNQTVAEALKVDNKLKALNAIFEGSVLQTDYDMLADDWEIESRCKSALDYWQLSHLDLSDPVDRLSGGEKTKLFLSGILIHTPGIVLLDEPSNHLDGSSRKLLYQFIRQSTATFVIVSHDRTLLDQLDTSFELSGHGIRLYGGNYSFYAEQKKIEEQALEENIQAEEKTMRLARKKAQEVRERQEKRLSKGEKSKTEVPRIFRKTLTNSSENTAARLNNKHTEIIQSSSRKLFELRTQKRALKELKINFGHATLHTGKLLIEAKQINYAYTDGKPLWSSPIDFNLYSNDRIRIEGSNGSGKTTLVKLLTGMLPPQSGKIKLADFNSVYLDQNYTAVDVDSNIEQLAEKYNINNLPEHEVKIRLNRFLFPASTWNKRCRQLSGGEKMRLYLCCLMISNQTPDLIVLDEPTNNLDMANMQILTQTIANYKGSLLIISHDSFFVSEIGITRTILLNKRNI